MEATVSFRNRRDDEIELAHLALAAESMFLAYCSLRYVAVACRRPETRRPTNKMCSDTHPIFASARPFSVVGTSIASCRVVSPFPNRFAP